MVSEWTRTSLANVITIISGGTPKTTVPDYWNGVIPWLSVADFNTGYRWVSKAEKHITEKGLNESATTLLEQGDIIISARGTVGALAQLAKPMAFNQSCYGIRGKNGTSETDFIYYALRQAVADMKQVAHGGVFDTITRDTFSIVECYLPPLPEQRAIAHILGTLDDKIELNRRRNQTLEAMARALFKDWFVDFGPVRAKMEGREPYLPADLWQLFPDRLDDEGKPEGWQSSTLASFASLNPESWTKKNAPDDIRYVDLSNTKQGTIEGTARMPWSDAPSRAQRILRTGDTIVGTVRPGNKSFALIGDEGMTGSTGFAVLRPLERHCRDFVFLAATSPENIERLTHLADGAAYPAVRPAVVLASPVTIPAEETVNDVLRGFANAVSNWVDAIEKNKQESRTLAQLRDTLLPKLISGELRVADAEKFIESVGV